MDARASVESPVVISATLSLVKLISLVRKCWMVFSMHLLVPSCCRVVDRQSTSFCLLFTYCFSLFFFFFLFIDYFPFDKLIFLISCLTMFLQFLVLTHGRLIIRFMFGRDGYILCICEMDLFLSVIL